MPITPLHVGPGILIKSFIGRRISLTVFALSQVTMDVEVIARAAVDAEQWHGFTNTFIGATVLLVPTVLFGKPACEWVLRWWNRNLSPGQVRWLEAPTSIGWFAAWTGGITGVYSHLILDAIMHADARPWAPLSGNNPFAGFLSIGQLTLLCLVSLLLGTMIIGLTRARRRHHAHDTG